MPLVVKRPVVAAALLHSVALVGMDGSGKSTQAGRLRRSLEARQARVLLIHPFGRKLLSFLPDRLAGRVRGAGRRARRSKLAQLAAVIEMLDIAVFIWAAYIGALAAAFTTDREVWLVSDRSFDDLLVKHRRLGTLSPRALAAARRLAPVPRRTIWLHTEPTAAQGRDGEFEAGYYQELHATYAFAAAQYGWDIVQTTDLTPDAVAADIERLLGPGTGRAPAGGGELLAGAQTASRAQQPEARTDGVRQS